jgi:hypothetical protein
MDAPSAWQIEKAVSAFEQAMATLPDNALAPDENIILTMLDGERVAHPVKLLDRVIDACAWAITRAEEADAMRASFRDRRDRYRQRAGFLKQLALDLMGVIDLKKRTASLARVRIGESQPGVVITDEEALEDRFVKITREPRRIEIKAALEAGEVVDGAVLSNRAATVTLTRHARPLADVDLIDSEDDA